MKRKIKKIFYTSLYHNIITHIPDLKKKKYLVSDGRENL